MNNNSKVKRLQLVNLVCYLFVIIVVALMWIFGLKVNTSESNPDSFGGAIGEAAAGIREGKCRGVMECNAIQEFQCLK